MVWSNYGNKLHNKCLCLCLCWIKIIKWRLKMKTSNTHINIYFWKWYEKLSLVEPMSISQIISPRSNFRLKVENHLKGLKEFCYLHSNTFRHSPSEPDTLQIWLLCHWLTKMLPHEVLTQQIFYCIYSSMIEMLKQHHLVSKANVQSSHQHFRCSK